MDTLIGHPVTLNAADVVTARESALALRHYTPNLVEKIVRLCNKDKTSEEIRIPATAFRLIVQILDQLGDGNAVMCVPVHAELTTQQAADLLSVSRPFLIGLLKKEMIPFTKVGTHRRVLLKDLLRYKTQRQVQRSKAMVDLMGEMEELGLRHC